MTRAAHQNIDDLAHALGQRAEIEGLAKGVRIGARRQIVRWTLRWGIAFAAALALGLPYDGLRWLPAIVAAVGVASLVGIFLVRARAERRIDAARAGLQAGPASPAGPGGTDRP